MNKIMTYYYAMNVLCTIFQMMDPDGELVPDCFATWWGLYPSLALSRYHIEYRQFFAHVLEENLAYQQFWVNFTTSACPK